MGLVVIAGLPLEPVPARQIDRADERQNNQNKINRVHINFPQRRGRTDARLRGEVSRSQLRRYAPPRAVRKLSDSQEISNRALGAATRYTAG